MCFMTTNNNALYILGVLTENFAFWKADSYRYDGRLENEIKDHGLLVALMQKHRRDQ